MAEVKNYRHVRMDVADNGFIVDYTEVMSKDPGNPAADTIHKDHRELFTFKEGQKALNRIMELKGIKPPEEAKEASETKADVAKEEVEG